MDMDRGEKVTLGGKEYTLVLTLRAQKEIAKKYGGMENIAEELDGVESMDAAIWFITLLANQSILIDNLQNNEKQPLLTEAEVELLSSPGQFQDFVPLLESAISKGMKRHVESEDSEEKNAPAG